MEIQGHIEPGFEKVGDAFAANFEHHGEVGAAFALHVDGELKVDIWGGTADGATGRPWTDRTLALVFSTTKGITAICAGMLHDRGELDFDARVADYWPEFAQNGKEAITVAQVLTHQAGLPSVDAQLSVEDVLAVTPIVEALAAQAPLWAPGSGHGYHALTYGWLVGEIIRRVDGRRLNDFLQAEIAGPLGVEVWMGLPEEEEARIARLEPAPQPTPEEQALIEMMLGEGTLGWRALTLDGVFATAEEGDEIVWNTRAVHASEMPAANAITSARALSTIYGATVAEVNGVRLLAPATVDEMRAERVRGGDNCLVMESRFGLGFMLNNPLNQLLSDDSFGHPGAGGSLGYADPATGVGYGYVMNQMAGNIAGDPRTISLNEAVRACL